MRNLLAFIFGCLILAVISSVAIAQNEAVVSLQNDGPIADTGYPRVIEVGAPVILDASQSISPSGLRLTYQWSLVQKPSGSLAVLNGADAPRPSFTPDLVGDYRAELTVTDSGGNSSAARTLLLTTNNAPPVAVAGADRVTTIGESLRLDPEGTLDANGDRLDAVWSILSYSPATSNLITPTAAPINSGASNVLCPINTAESSGVFYAVSAASNQQNPHLAIGEPLAEGSIETGSASATTYYGPITMDLTGDAAVFVPEGEVIQVVLSSAWGTSGRVEILMSADGENYTSLGTVGNGGSVYGAYESNVLRYDDFTVPSGGVRFLQVVQQNSGIRADGVIYNTQCESSATGQGQPDAEDPNDFASLTEDEGGRFVFAPSVAGNFAVQLTVEDEDGAQSTDVVNIYVAPADGTGDPANLNIAPVANAGPSQLITADQTVILDGSQSTDINGDMLTYQWSILSKAADSFSVLENSASARATLTPDTDRTYILQLAVTDMLGLTDYDTVVLSGDFIVPTSISGGPIAGADGAITNQTASVNGASSQSGRGLGLNLDYDWSVLGLSEGDGSIDNNSNFAAVIDFLSQAGEGALGDETQDAIELLGDHNLIVFGDLDSSVDTEGRALVGGDLFGNSATFGTQISQGQNIEALTVVGNISGGAKNINNGGNVLLGGSVSSQLNLNGGGQLINDPILTILSEQTGLLELSESMAGLTANSSAQIPNPNGQNAPARLNASPDENGVAVIDIADGNALFSNDRVQQIEVNANGAESIIVNVGGENIDFDRGNFVGAIGNTDLQSRIIWNFHEATDLFFERQFNGTLLAPQAHLSNRSIIRGTVIVDSLEARGPIARPSFTGGGLAFEAEDQDTDFALVQLAVTDNFNPSLAPSYSTTVLTTGNLRPVARIAQLSPSEPLPLGVEVRLDATPSIDGNNDLLSYSWAIVSKPQGSSIVLSDTNTTTVSATPDGVGLYVVQLIVSDGALTSKPVTVAFEVQSSAPIANAGGDQTVLAGQLVTLDGASSSDPDGNELTFSWSLLTKPEGSLAELSGFESANPSFTADITGEYVVGLIVNDGTESSELDEVIITVPNNPPQAIITGPTNGVVDNMIALSGAQSSDPDGDTLTYLWTLAAPEESSVTLNDPTSVAPLFTPDIGGTYALTLLVSDGNVNSAPISLVINVENGNRAPVLEAIGNQTVSLGGSLNFTTTAIDSDGDDLSFFVNTLPLPAGATFDATSGQFSFAPRSASPQQVTLAFGVTDGELSDSQSVTFTVTTNPDFTSTSFTGRVIDSETGEPLTGVSVEVGNITVTTNSNGVFTASGLTSGVVEICIETDGAINGQSYGAVHFTTNLIEGVLNQHQGDIALSRALVSGQFEEGEDIILQNNAAGVRFEAGADSLFNNVQPSRFWRLLFNSSAQPDQANAVVAFAELTFESRSDNTNIATNLREISASSSFGGNFGPDRLIDNDLSTLWSGTVPTGGGEWVAYDFGASNKPEVNLVTITARGDGFGPIQAPRDFEIQISEDGQAWTTIQTIVGETDWRASETRSFTVGGEFEGSISLVETQAENIAVTPPTGNTCAYYSINTKSAFFASDVSLTIPNRDDYLENTPLDIFASFDGAFRKIGDTRVGSNSSSITAEISGLRGGEYIAILPQPLEGAIGADQDTGIQTPNSLADGNFAKMIAMPPVSTIFGPHPIDLIYNSQSADPQIFLSADITIPADYTIPQSISLSGEVAGLDIGEVFISTTAPQALSEAVEEVIRQAISHQASEIETGSYPYRLTITSNYECSSANRDLIGRVTLINERNSAFGAGFTLTELDRVDLQDDGTALLVSGTGQSRTFSQTVRPTNVPPATGLLLEMFDTPNSVVAVATGFEGLERGEFTITQPGQSDITVDEWPISIVNFPDTGFDRSAFYNVGLNNVIDTGSSATNPQGDDFSIQPPGGNNSFGARLSGFLYVPDGGDIEFQLVIDDTFDLILGGRTLTRFISQTDSRRFIATLPDVPPGFIPIIINFSENTGEANLTLEASGGGLPGSFLSSENFYLEIPNINGFEYASPDGDFSQLNQNEDGSFTRRLKNGTIYEFNADGLMTSVSDTNGNTRSYDYDADGRLITITDPGNLLTQFVYGADGRVDRITDAAGRSSNFSHDADGNLASFENTDSTVQTFRYDANGKVVAYTDEDGFESEFDYGEAGQLATVTVPDGEQINTEIGNRFGLANLGPSTEPVEFTRPDERISEIVDARGNESLMQYNEFDAVIFMRDAVGRETRYERDENNLVTAIIAPSSVTESGTLRTELEYDDLGNVTRIVEAVNTWLERVKTYEYEPVFSQVTRMVDYDGFETVYSYDDRANLLSITDPLGGVQRFTYDTRGLRVSQTDENGNVTTMSYDAIGRIVGMVDPSDTQSSYLYDDAGNLILTREAIGTDDSRSTSAIFDDRGRQTNYFAADGGETVYVYDGRNNITSVTDPTGIIETRSYDERDRLEVINDPATGATVMVYDADSNIIRMTDAIGDTTEFEYDAVDRMLSSVDARGQLRAFAYDLRDNITAITDARANITLVTYDKLDRPVSRTNPNSETWSFDYDLRDNRVQATKPDGVVINSTYDGLSRMTGLVSTANGSGAVTRSYSYDPYDNLLAANDTLDGVSGVELAYSYDQENRTSSASTSNLFGANVLNNTHRFTYDPLDRRAVMTDSFDGNTAYAYDPVDRLTALTTPQDDVFLTNYDLAGRVLGRMAPNLTDMVRQYEAATGRLSSQVQNSSAVAFNDFGYDYTERGNISGIAESGEVVRTKAYSYDELERLTEVSTPGNPEQNETYELDPEGNRLSSQLSDSHETDPSNRLTSDDTYTYVYDLNGNLISKLPKLDAPTGTPEWAYEYDALDQLITVIRDSLPVERYRYDAFGRRTQIVTLNGAGGLDTLGIINDGSDRTIDVANDNGTLRPLRRYTHGRNVDEPLQVETFDSSGAFAARYTYHADHLGSIRFLTDALGQVVNAYDYDSYGRVTAELAAFEQPFRFTGREWDEAAQLYHYRARNYDPSTGRFIQEDPIGFAAGDLNIYRYVGSNPLTYTDPSGLSQSSERASLGQIGGRAAFGVARVGSALGCLFTAIASGIEVATNPDVELLGLVTDVGFSCAAKTKVKKPKPKKDGKNSKDKEEICPTKCFAAGTLVHTREGLKPIEQIQAGDEVKSMNPQTGEIAYKRVTNTHVNKFDPTGVVSLLDKTDGSETHLSVTATHPFHHSEKGWVHASLLRVGDTLTEDDGGTLTVTTVKFDPNAPINLTYNLEVTDFHTYFVGEDGVLVHNGNRYVPVALKRALIDSDKTPSFIKGWYKQQLNAGCPLSRTQNPPGHDWGHHPSAPASRGHGHGPRSRLELSRDNRGRGGRHGR